MPSCTRSRYHAPSTHEPVCGLESTSRAPVTIAAVRRTALGATFLTLVGLLSARVVELIHASRLAIVAEDLRGILSGQPYSAAFANRRLGPWSFAVLEEALGSAEAALRIPVWIAGLALPWLAYLAGRRLGWSQERALCVALALCGAYVLLQDDRCLMPWDLYDLLFFVGVAYAIHARLGPLAAAPLFALMLLNRETALVLPLWLVWRGFREGDLRSCFVGALMGLAGGAVLLFLRLPYLGEGAPLPIATFPFGNHFRLFANARLLLGGQGDAWLSLGLGALVVALAWKAWGAGQRAAEEALALSAVGVVAIFAMGHLGEARLLLPIAPLVAFSLASLQREAR